MKILITAFTKRLLFNSNYFQSENIFIKSLLFSFLCFLTFLNTASAQNYGLSFDGSSNYGYLPSAVQPSGNNFSVEAWVYLDPSGGSDQKILCNLTWSGGAKGFAMNIYKDGNGYYYNSTIYLSGTDRWTQSTGYLPVNTWLHIAMTWAVNDSIRSYLNGEIVGSTGTNAYTYTNSGVSTYLGTGTPGWAPFKGKIDEVRFWSTTRTQSEIKANMNKELSGSETGLTHYYKMTNGTGSTLSDNKGSSNGSLSGVSWQQPGAYPVNAFVSSSYAACYANIKGAFDAINAGTHSGAIELKLAGNTNEISSAVLNASGSGSASYTSINIYPTQTGLSITGNLTAPLIDLNGADNVTFDGRVNASGTTKDLTISNTSTSNAESGTASTIRFINTAQNNTVKYCTIKGSTKVTTAGVIYFSTASTGTGNSSNTIDNNDITSDAAGRPYNTIYSLGSNGYVNSNNYISNNNIYNILNSGLSSTGILISSFSSDWTISGNSFFETTTLTTTAANEYDLIKVNNTSGNNFVITGNYIGGQSAQCGGSPMTINGAFAHYIQCIEINAGTTTASSIQNNTIKNIAYTSTHTTYPFIGIWNTGGNVNIGTTTGNTIGAVTGNGSITVTNTTANTISYGICINSTGNVNVENNNIGSITTVGSASISHSFCGIYKSSSAGTTNISNNNIGSLSTANSIQSSSSSTSTTSQNVYGIQSLGTGTVTISGNTIANMFNAYAYTSASTGQIAGIVTTAGTNTINGNSIHDISTTSPNTSYSNSASVIGISQNSTASGQNVSGDTIYNLSNTYSGSNLVSIFGLYYAGGTGGTNSVSRIFLHDLSLSSSNTNSQIQGILIISGVTTYSNNIISLGKSISTGYLIEGIYEGSAANNNTNFYFNTVYISGNPSGGSNTSALKNASGTANTRNYRNNILFNARSNSSGSAKHYAMCILSGSGSIVSDYNDYFANGTGGVLGYFASSDKTVLPIVTTQDVNSVTTNPLFPSAKANGNLPGDFKPGTRINGVAGTGIATDYTGYTRPETPTLGFFEVDNPLPIILQSFTSNVNYRDIKLNWVTSSEINNIGFEIQRAEVRSTNSEFNKIGFISGMGTKETPTSYTFEDKKLNTGKYNYRLKQIDGNGNYEYFTLNNEVEVGLPSKFDISQNYPNPFNPTTKIDFSLPNDAKVKITIFDITGKEITTLVNGNMKAGFHTIQFNASALSSGIYFYRFISNSNGKEFIFTKKMSLIK